MLGTHIVAGPDLGPIVGLEQAGGMAYLLGQSGELVEMDPVTGAYTVTVIPPGCAQYAEIQASANGQELYLLRKLCGSLQTVIDVHDIASGTTMSAVVTDSVLVNPVGITLGAGGYVYIANRGTGSAGKSMKAWDPATWTEVGYFLASQTPGFLMNPGGSVGNICLANPIARFNAAPIPNSGSIGRVLTDVDLTQVPGPQGPIAVMPGDTWYFQCWHRDTGNTSNFSDGISVTFQ